jgi:hypothetical protein
MSSFPHIDAGHCCAISTFLGVISGRFCHLSCCCTNVYNEYKPTITGVDKNKLRMFTTRIAHRRRRSCSANNATAYIKPPLRQSSRLPRSRHQPALGLHAARPRHSVALVRICAKRPTGLASITDGAVSVERTAPQSCSSPDRRRRYAT